MKKVIFKGTINGKDFDNIKDYNEAMRKLIEEGSTTINASSSTQIVDEVSEKKDVKLVDELKPENDFIFDLNNYTPFFEDTAEYYLDTLVSDDSELNERNMLKANQILKDAYSNLVKDLKKNNIGFDDAFELINKLKDIRSGINADSDDNKEVINSLTNQIKKDTKRLEIVKNASPVIDLLSSFYNDSFDLIKSYLLKF